jgi:hypothetical protein
MECIASTHDQLPGSNFKQPNLVIASASEAIHAATSKQEWIASSFHSSQ